MTTITRIDSNARMSEAVVYNGMIFLAGQIGEKDQDITEQTRTALAEIDAALAKAGSDKTRILSAQIWLADINRDFAAMNAVWDAWVPAGHTPARATGESKLAAPEYLVEIIVVAATA